MRVLKCDQGSALVSNRAAHLDERGTAAANPPGLQRPNGHTEKIRGLIFVKGRIRIGLGGRYHRFVHLRALIAMVSYRLRFSSNSYNVKLHANALIFYEISLRCGSTVTKHHRPPKLPPLVKTLPSAFASVQRQVGRDWYQTPEHKAWRIAVLKRAGWRCQAIGISGERCKNAAPDHRLYADHIVEIEDGGSPTNLGNGQCLCHAHHTMKTALMRSERAREGR